MCAQLTYRVRKHEGFIRYFSISVFVTIVDFILSRLSEGYVGVVTANTIGVVGGFIVQYFLAARHVYGKQDRTVFAKFLATFAFGLLLANLIVWFGRTHVFGGSDSTEAFLWSKAASTVLPFFALYFIRKKWIGDFSGQSMASEHAAGLDTGKN